MTMTTKHTLTDEDWLAKFAAGDIDFDPHAGWSLIDLAEVRAYELLVRESEEALVNAVRLARQNGAPWADIATALGTDEADSIATYGDRIGAAADAAGAEAPTDDNGAPLVAFYVRYCTAVAKRGDAAIDRALSAGIDRASIENIRSRSDDDARLRWNQLG